MKEVTHEKLGYKLIEVNSEKMVKNVRETPKQFYAYSVSVALDTYHLYRLMIHDFIFALNNKNECYTLENDTYAHGGYEFDPETKK